MNYELKNTNFAPNKVAGQSVAGMALWQYERKVRAAQGIPLANLQAVREG